MIVSPSELEVQLFKCCPREFLAATIRAVWAAYRTLERDCERYEFPEKEYMRGHARRANVEARWRRVAESFDALKVKIRPNKTKSAHYTLVGAGRLRLTASAVGSPGILPKEAIFRTNLASQQMSLLDPNPHLPRTRALYAILTHGWGRDLCSPGFVTIAFPAADYKTALATISLQRHFPEVWGEEEEKQAIVPMNDRQHLLFSSGLLDEYGEPTQAQIDYREERVEEEFNLNLKKQDEENREGS